MTAFPEDFMWGTAASSTQVEGAAPASDWARWERLGRAPASGEGNGFAARHAEDFELLASLGLTHHRLSLEWARLEPVEGRHDGAAVEHYRRVLTAAREAGLAPWVCLHHFTLPGWFSEDMGGFRDDRARTYHWPRHVDWVAETFGDLVHGWKPVNEPLAYAAGGWLLGTMPPGGSDAAHFAEALRATHLADVEAALILRGEGHPVASVMNLSPVRSRPAEATEEARGAARGWARLVDDVHWGCWVSLLRDGRWADPFGAAVEVPGATEAFDLVGFSYYSAIAVDEHGAMGPWPAEGRRGPLGHPPYAAGLRECLERLAEELPGRRLLVSEVGLGTSPDDDGADEARCDYMREVAGIAADALAGGIDLAGLFWWTGVDNYEWSLGWGARFGLVGRDRAMTGAAALAHDLATGRD
jgi:beta-glucosidase